MDILLLKNTPHNHEEDAASPLKKPKPNKGEVPDEDGLMKAAESPELYASKKDKVADTILVVEDQSDVRELLMCVLSDEGFEVLEADNGSDALRILQANKHRIHVMVTDVLMPGMNGGELADHAQQLNEKLKVLFISGFTGQVLIQEKVPSPGRKFLAKPFSPYDLVNQIKDLIAARETSESQ